MKAFKIITHPVTVLISFLVILISGEQTGGFYLLYLLLGLPHGAIHSIIGVLGIVLLIFSNIKSRQGGKDSIRHYINLVAVLLLWVSLFLFFYNDKSNYNTPTFYQLVPQILLSLFFLISIFFFVYNIHLLLKHPTNNFYKSSASK